MAVVDPAEVDWTQVESFVVRHAAASGIPEAVAEAERRGLTY